MRSQLTPAKARITQLYLGAIAITNCLLICHCECSASGMKRSQGLGLLSFTLVRSQLTPAKLTIHRINLSILD
ncbi:hypothetical protein [Nostoc sp.]|uniref:hypothetical protein n=1 Tax=Nostoc sp. TaxID=1180 RepID=UPI002FFC7775